MIVILYNIRSSYNVGSIFRTADIAGIEKIYLCGITPAPLDKFGDINKKLVKISLGAEKNVFFERVKSIHSLIFRLRKEGYIILALEQDSRSQNIFKFRKKENKRYALILGSEIKGLPESILKKADKILEIPQKGKKESLNVSIAFAIAVFYLEFVKC